MTTLAESLGFAEERAKKLPAWARNYIAYLRREHDAALLRLDEFTDAQKPSRIYTTGLNPHRVAGGDPYVRNYIQADEVSINHAGVHLAVRLRGAWESRADACIDCQYFAERPDGHVGGTGDVVLQPRSHQHFYLFGVPKE